MLRRQVRYVGRVQGVGFRASARHLAASFAVSGWVRNEADGSVLLEAQGSPDEVDRFLNAVTDRLARHIRSASTADAATVPSESGFAIQH